ncbi:hypothetical protein F2Q69_00048843 [Brassica cretica]|uniref:Zinc knuckle CX2CX4HX4C domain-containing protein n=1 Tax=Brassica cretica TaxID=69181 RepID=A0A8S9Q388_BRACR|nr:hypothetical protein F2Q69_00048843 [Brassica cretica]
MELQDCGYQNMRAQPVAEAVCCHVAPPLGTARSALEALALLFAMQSTWSCGFLNVIFEVVCTGDRSEAHNLTSKIYLAIAKYNSVNGQPKRLRAKIQVSINVENPIKFERRVDFPNGDIGRVTLAYDGLHRFCFNCKHISHDENSCPLLSEQEREDRRQQRLEYNINNDPRPHHSPPAWRDEKREEKRQRNTQHGHKEFLKSYRSEPKHLVEDKYPQSLGRNPHKHNDVWNKIERPQKDRDSGNVPRQSSDLYRRNRDGKSSRNYGAKPKLSWRPRPNQATTYPREARSSAAKARIDSEFSNSLVDSQRTISENVMGLEPGEIQNADAEIERRCPKGKGIASESPTSKEKDFHAMSALNRLAPLSIREPTEQPLSAATWYMAP